MFALSPSKRKTKKKDKRDQEHTQLSQAKHASESPQRKKRKKKHRRILDAADDDDGDNDDDAAPEVEQEEAEQRQQFDVDQEDVVDYDLHQQDEGDNDEVRHDYYEEREAGVHEHPLEQDEKYDTEGQMLQQHTEESGIPQDDLDDTVGVKQEEEEVPNNNNNNNNNNKNKRKTQSREKQRKTKAPADRRRDLGLVDSGQHFVCGVRGESVPTSAGLQAMRFSNDDLSNPATGAVGEIVQDVLQPFNPDSTEWRRVKEEDGAPVDSDDDTFCADCENDQNEEEREANPAVQEYRHHYEENVLEVERTRLAGQCQEIYNKKVRKYSDGQRFWSKRMLSEHFEVHAPTPPIIRAAEFRNLNFALRVMRQHSLYKQDSSGRVIVDTGAMRMYLQIMKERNSLMGQLFAGAGAGASKKGAT